MKKTLFTLSILITLNSCATLFGGAITESQTTKPAPGEPQRQVRVGALIADIILFWPSVAVDFATGAIYKPSDEDKNIARSKASEAHELRDQKFREKREQRKAEKKVSKMKN